MSHSLPHSQVIVQDNAASIFSAMLAARRGYTTTRTSIGLPVELLFMTSKLVYAELHFCKESFLDILRLPGPLGLHVQRCQSLQFDVIYSSSLPSILRDFSGVAPILEGIGLICMMLRSNMMRFRVLSPINSSLMIETLSTSVKLTICYSRLPNLFRSHSFHRQRATTKPSPCTECSTTSQESNLTQ